jgi:hypothetical protein
MKCWLEGLTCGYAPVNKRNLNSFSYHPIFNVYKGRFALVKAQMFIWVRFIWVNIWKLRARGTAGNPHYSDIMPYCPIVKKMFGIPH